MKKTHSFIKISAPLLLLLLFCWVSAFPQSEAPFSIDEAPLPNNGQPVNDFANVIDDATEAQLNQKLKDLMARTNPPIVLAVATVKTTNGRPIEQYALALYRGWKIGVSGDDNPGALLLVAVDDRKYRTEVGRDLEDELPDGIAGQLQRQHLVPAFRQGDYAKGINDTIDAYIRTIEQRMSGTFVTPSPTPGQIPGREGRRTGTSLSSGACCLIILVILMIIIFSRGGRGGRGGFGGGGFGGGGGALPWILGSILASNMGNRGGSSWGGGGFGGDGGGFGGGGGGGWGGFGGGGDAGGGGAGGDW
jgi:uncharacterized protein